MGLIDWFLFKTRCKKVDLDSNPKTLKVALIIDEFFGGAKTPYGGYGFLARYYICKYIPNEDITIDVLLRRRHRTNFAKKTIVDGINIYQLPSKEDTARKFLDKQNYDVYLSIELTFNVMPSLVSNPSKKLVLWIQDPRPMYEWDEINTVKLFPEPSYYDQKIYDSVHDWFKQDRLTLVSQAYCLNEKAIDLYKLRTDISIEYLPNPIEIDENFDVKLHQKKNQIIFLGRVESVKRPWLFFEIAKAMPEYDFVVLGSTHTGVDRMAKIISKYNNLPNLKFAGRVMGEEKNQYLKESKILVNTSIHEALPVSFLEAMAYGTLLVSNRNPDNLTSQFGVWTGDVLGDGFESISLYVDGIRELITNESKRSEMSSAAIEYVKKVHNIPRFVKDLRKKLYAAKNS